MIDTFYNSTYTVSRMTTSTSTGTDSAVTTFTGTCVVRPISEKAQLIDEANIGKEFKMSCYATDNISVGDKITIDSVGYGVQAVTKYEDLETGDDTHYEVRIVRGTKR